MEEALYLNDRQRAIIAARMANRPGAALKITFEMLQLKPVCRFRYRRPHSHQAGAPLTTARRWCERRRSTCG